MFELPTAENVEKVVVDEPPSKTARSRCWFTAKAKKA
jgi:hypothetical protein